MKSEEKWTVEIRPTAKLFELDLINAWRYRDLLRIFVHRDIVTIYKQTILGPLWYIIQPILTTLIFTLVFGKIANISTDGVPPLVFYLLGITIWGYFSDCINRTSNTFVTNQHIFGKVYFPRITVPASIVISTLLRFGIQFVIFLGLWSYYYYEKKLAINFVVLLLPLVILIMAIMSLGFGMIFSSLTTKYRDLQFLLSFAVQLWMYATPIIYPLSSIHEPYSSYIRLNPITPLVESMRFGFLGQGTFSLEGICYSSAFAISIFFFGLIFFSRAEKNFMDTV